MTDLRSDTDRPSLRRTATRPSIALVRGEALNPFEMQAYAPLVRDHDLLAIGRRPPNYEVDRLPMPVRLLPSLATSRVARAAHRRLPTDMRHRFDVDRLLGLRSAVAGRQVLHAAETVLPSSHQAAELARANKASLVLTCWETIPFRYDDDPVLRARKLAIRAVHPWFVAVTTQAKRALLDEGTPDSRIRVIPAAVDCDRFIPAQRSRPLLERFGIPDGATVVLFVGRLIQEKGVVELVRAFAGAQPDRQTHLLMIGNGNQAERVRVAAGALGIGDRVKLASGLSYSSLPGVYAAADLVVAPSLTTPYWEEQFGMVLVEAMASGRALITTASGAIPEVVGDAAVLVDPYAVGQLTDALRGLLDNPSRRAQLAEAARARALERYSIPVVADQIAQLYGEVSACH